MSRRYLLAAATILCLVLPTLASADATVTSVTPVDGGCVSGPNGVSTELWDVEPGKTYVATLTGVTECGNGGTDATINVRVNGTSQTDPQNTDLVATLVAPGVYEFTFTVPIDASCTMPIFYCTTPGVPQSGILAKSSADPSKGVHFRASTFGPGCTDPVEIQGPNCRTVPARPSTWSRVKSFYR